MNIADTLALRRAGLTWLHTKRRGRPIRLGIRLTTEEDAKTGKITRCGVHWMIVHKGHAYTQAFAWTPDLAQSYMFGLQPELRREFRNLREAFRRVLFGKDFRQRRAIESARVSRVMALSHFCYGCMSFTQGHVCGLTAAEQLEARERRAARKLVR